MPFKLKEYFEMHLNSDLELTYPVIIMRTGGLDGVALQAREYRHLLNKLDINVHVMTGRCETKFATVNPIGHKQTVISRLDFYHKDSQLLFANQFVHGSEKEEKIPEITLEEWFELFNMHKSKIKKSINKILQAIPYNTPVLIYNLVSLRHAHPACAVALKELMEEYPERAFISHSADPDAERPEKIGRIKKEILPVLSCFDESQPYSGGPYNLNNLYHIVLNPTQRESFINKYNIPKNHIFEIPDFLDFVSSEPPVRLYPKKIFLKFLSDRCLKLHKKSYNYINSVIDKDTVIFISPVRPVYRKRLKESMVVAQQYGKIRNVKVAFIVTHPNHDDKDYFMETLQFAQKLGLGFYHLGKEFTLETLDSVYENLAAMKTIGAIASSAGGWENALNEMARACIPFHMDKNLNSFKPLTQEIGIKTHGTDFSKFTHIIKENTPEEIKKGDFSAEPELMETINWIDLMLFNNEEHHKLIEHNYNKAYNYLSHEATIPKLIKGINYIYERHGHPGQKVKASTLKKITYDENHQIEQAKDILPH